MYIYIYMYTLMYKKDLLLDKPQGLMCHKTQPSKLSQQQQQKKKKNQHNVS